MSGIFQRASVAGRICSEATERDFLCSKTLECSRQGTIALSFPCQAYLIASFRLEGSCLRGFPPAMEDPSGSSPSQSKKARCTFLTINLLSIQIVHATQGFSGSLGAQWGGTLV